jgi:hypothetical protein
LRHARPRRTRRAECERAHAAAHGADIAAAELADRVERTYASLTPGELTRWLIGRGLAVERDGRLAPTAQGLELGAALVTIRD